MDHDGRRARPTLWQRLRKNASAFSTARLWGTSILVLAIATPPLWLSAEFLHTHIVSAVRGITVDAVVVKRETYRRGPDELILRLVNDQNIRTTISHWPRGTDVGDTLEVAYDPRNPGRVVATDAPWVDVPIAVVALADVGVIALLACIVPVAVVTLAERRRQQHATGPVRDSLGQRCRRWCRAVWQWMGHEARNEGPFKALLIFVFLPVVLAVLGAMIVVPDAQGLRALQTRGVAGTATVKGSEWDDGVGTELHVVLGNGSFATIHHWTGVPQRGETIEVVYDPQNPRVAQHKGVHPWGRDQWLLAGVLSAGVFGTVFVAPAAITGMVRPARSGVRQSDAAS